MDSLRMNLNNSNISEMNDFEMGLKIKEKVSFMRINNNEIERNKEEECTICLTLLTNNTYNNFVVKTGCGHLFHNECLTKSLRNDNRCPNCRKEIIVD